MIAGEPGFQVLGPRRVGIFVTVAWSPLDTMACHRDGSCKGLYKGTIRLTKRVLRFRGSLFFYTGALKVTQAFWGAL